MAKQFVFLSFTTPVEGTLNEVIENDTTTRNEISLQGSEMTKGKSVGASIMLKIGKEVAQYYTVSRYGNPIPQKDLKYQDKKIVAGPGMKPTPKWFLPGYSKEKVGKETPQK